MGEEVRNKSEKMTVYDHIRELKTRLLISGFALIVASIIVFFFYQPLLKFLSSPLGSPLYYNNPAGGFNYAIKVCLAGALIITMPILVYNVIMFISPALEKLLSIKKVFMIAGLSTLLAIAGAAFAFYCILPGTLNFLNDFQVSGLNALITADDYLKFVTNIIITFVVVFQLPLIITFFDSVKPVQTIKLIKMEKWVILGSVIIALIAPITYEVVTSLMLAIPIIVLYNLSILIIVIRHSLVRRKTISDHATPRVIETPSMIIDDQTIACFAEELENIGKNELMPAPINTACVRKQMDIMPKPSMRGTIQPAAWVRERQLQRMSLNTNVKVFSDIRPVTRINPVLASQ